MFRLIPTFILMTGWLLCLPTPGNGATPGIAIAVDAPRVSRDQFDGSKHPMPFLPYEIAAKKSAYSVVVRVTVAKDGNVREAAVVRSSGSRYLDEDARCWVRYVWRYPKAREVETHQETVTFQMPENRVNESLQSIAIGRTIYPDTPRPLYPYMARRFGWQGIVVLALTADGKGKVARATIVKSSGTVLLDLTAKSYAETYWNLPGNVNKTAAVAFRLH